MSLSASHVTFNSMSDTQGFFLMKQSIKGLPWHRNKATSCSNCIRTSSTTSFSWKEISTMTSYYYMITTSIAHILFPNKFVALIFDWRWMSVRLPLTHNAEVRFIFIHKMYLINVIRLALTFLSQSLAITSFFIYLVL